MFILSCKVCDCEFEAKTSRRVYCSKRCTDKGKPSASGLECRYCGKRMTRSSTSAQSGVAACTDCRRSVPKPRAAKSACSKCERESYCRGLCRKHYEDYVGYVQPPRAMVDRQCADCGVLYSRRASEAKGEPRCHRCACKRAQAKREPRPIYGTSRVICGVTCAHCEGLFTARHGSKKYCSEYCATEAVAVALGNRNRSCRECGHHLGYKSLDHLCSTCKDLNRKAYRKRDRAGRDSADKNHRSRARKYGVEHESVNRRKVFDRDGWVCGICEDPIFESVKYPDPMCVSLDHVVPLSRGGGHLYSNTQASHLACNIRKGASE